MHGYDAGKKINGRKRHIVVDTLGLLLCVMVHSGAIQDRDGARRVLEKLKTLFPFLKVVFADAGYAGNEMHSTKKGNQWYFGMKAHIGVDAGSGYTHTVDATAANEHDVTKAPDLIREDDDVVYGDAGYTGIEKRDEIRTDPHKSQIDYRINERPGKTDKLPEGIAREVARESERRKSSVRSKVEHPFRIVKVLFGYRKAVYRGLAKNLNRLHMLFGSANLLMWAWAGRPQR